MRWRGGGGVYVCVCVHVNACIYVNMCMYVCVCVCLCVYVCASVCTYVKGKWGGGGGTCTGIVHVN